MNHSLKFLIGAMLAIPLNASAFDFTLQGGSFYGPGDKGVFPFPLGSLNNFVLTGPLQGFIAFDNNGAAAPNILAEGLQVDGIVDGALSDGTLLNENLNNGFVLNTNDPKNGSVSTMVAAVEGGPFNGQEIVAPDAKGNLTIQVYSAFDSGDPSQVAKAVVRPTTGAVRIPLSVKTQMGWRGGHDFAGPYRSGRVLIGRIGDFDQDGFMDGDLVLAEQSPPQLLVAEGDPVFFNRPFTSDIPLTPVQASVMTVNGVVQNFPAPMHETYAAGEVDITFGYLSDITQRIDAALGNVRRALRDKATSHASRQKLEYARSLLLYARYGFHSSIRELETNPPGHRGRNSQSEDKAEDALRVMGQALNVLNRIK